jgi:hypothetical protein
MTFPEKSKNINTDDMLNFKVNNSMIPTEEYDFAFMFNVSNDIVNTITLEQEKFDMMMPIYVSLTYAITPINKFKPFIVDRFETILEKYKAWANNALRGEIHLLYLDYISSFYELDDENKSFYNPNYIKLITPKNQELSEIIERYNPPTSFENVNVYIRFKFQLLSNIFYSTNYLRSLQWEK